MSGRLWPPKPGGAYRTTVDWNLPSLGSFIYPHLLASNIYPAMIGVWRSTLACWAGRAAVPVISGTDWPPYPGPVLLRTAMIYSSATTRNRDFNNTGHLLFVRKICGLDYFRSLNLKYKKSEILRPQTRRHVRSARLLQQGRVEVDGAVDPRNKMGQVRRCHDYLERGTRLDWGASIS